MIILVDVIGPLTPDVSWSLEYFDGPDFDPGSR